MKEVTASTAGLTLLAMSEVPNFLAGMAPSLFTLQHMANTSSQTAQESRRTMTRAYVIGGALSGAVGIGASLVADSPLPFVATVVVFVILVSQYEWALGTPHESQGEMFTE